MRLPGTGEGVARLVPLSMVKVDMGPCSAARRAQPAPPAPRPIDNRQHNGIAASLGSRDPLRRASAEALHPRKETMMKTSHPRADRRGFGARFDRGDGAARGRRPRRAASRPQARRRQRLRQRPRRPRRRLTLPRRLIRPTTRPPCRRPLPRQPQRRTRPRGGPCGCGGAGGRAGPDRASAATSTAETTKPAKAKKKKKR